MDALPSATLPIPDWLAAQLREGLDLGFSLSTLKPGDTSAPRWLTSVRVQVSGKTLVRSVEGKLLTVTLIAMPQISVPNLRWDPADAEFTR